MYVRVSRMDNFFIAPVKLSAAGNYRLQIQQSIFVGSLKQFLLIRISDFRIKGNVTEILPELIG